MRLRLLVAWGLAVSAAAGGARQAGNAPAAEAPGQRAVQSVPGITTATAAEVPMDDPRIVLLGRYDATDRRAPRLGYPGTGLMLRFRGTSVTMDVESDSATAALTLVLDHGEPTLVVLNKGANQVPVTAPGTAWDSAAVAHTLAVYKRTETWQGVVTLRGVEPGASTLLDAPEQPMRRLLFLGDSVTCGSGVNNTSTCKNPAGDPASDAYDSYGMVLGRRMDARVQLVCYGGRGLERDYRGLGVRDNVLNGPQFLDLAIPTDDPAGRRAWDHTLYTPDAIVVSLGTNDFNLQSTRPLDEAAFVADYAALLRQIRTEYPRALLLATEGAIVTNPLLRAYIRQSVAQVHDPRTMWMAAGHYPGNGCDGHPTREQHRFMADDIERVLRRQLGW